MKMRTHLLAVLAALFVFGAAGYTLQAAPQGKNVKIQQHTKEALMESFILAFAHEDKDAMWQLMPPQLRATVTKTQQVEKAKQILWDSAMQNTDEQTMMIMKMMINDDAKRKFAAATLVNQLGSSIVKVGDKYYFDPISALASTTTPEQVSALKKPDAIDHSTPEKLIETFYLAILFDDVDTAFDAFSPAVHKQLRQEGNADAAQKKFMNAFTSVINPQMREQLRIALAGDMKDACIATMKQQLKKALVQVNGKWYLMIRK